jgi:hypothetical protein
MTDSNLVPVPVWTPPQRYDPLGDTWEQMAGSADQIFGADLETAESLIGVPHIILLATFRLGDYQRPDLKIPGDYVSLDVLTAPETEIDRARLRAKIAPDSHVRGNERLVWNASGTGAYRQVVSYLEARKLILLPEGPDGGEYGQSRLDTPVSKWNIHQSATYRLDSDGLYQSAEFDIRLLCPRGLRKSEYGNEKSKEAVTYYLA